MKRDIEKQLSFWKTDPHRMPLIIRGARQVGKTFTVVSFGEKSFESIAVVNFEQNKNCHSCFDSLKPTQILQELEILLNQRIIPGKTLLFLDEIQDCPQAITALRYFKEELPELHVIAAGSLLEFVLNDDSFSFPVGRVQFLYMRPLSFMEFLKANKLTTLYSYLEKTTLESPPSDSVHQEFLKWIRLYCILGGMPAVVQKFIENASILSCRHLQDYLLNAFEQDFGKYASTTQHRNLQRLFEKSPEFVGSYVRYSKIDPEASNPAREYKQAIKLLSNAGLIHPILATSANGIPLQAEVNEKKFKLLYLDIGLLQSSMETDPQFFLSEDISIVNKGPISEQLTGQELLAYSDPHRDGKLYFWQREQAGSEAEVDYIIQIGPRIFPVEVKATKVGRLRSLRIFIEEKKSLLGITISSNPLSVSDGILNIPFYLINQLPRFVAALIS